MADTNKLSTDSYYGPSNGGYPSNMQGVKRLLRQLALSPLPILLIGETGCGKEVLADWVQRHSPRKDRRFVKVNCAGLSESVVESEIFGHERGAFTGAIQTRTGLFEAANGGTLFLDELAELPLRTQAKLLRVLENGEYTRLGSTEVRHVDVRLIAATHQQLTQMCEEGKFRRDLLHRLGGATVEIPPLRERVSEILGLAEYFLEKHRQSSGRAELTLSPEAERYMLTHPWPGNVRELRNAIGRGAALTCGTVITLEALMLTRTPSSPPPHNSAPEVLPSSYGHGSSDLRGQVLAFEKARIVHALKQSKNNRTRAAMLLGISRRTLTNKLNQHNLCSRYTLVSERASTCEG